MARPSRRPKYDLSELSLQIESDLKGVIRLGQMQAQLLRQVQTSLAQLTRDSEPLSPHEVARR